MNHKIVIILSIITIILGTMLVYTLVINHDNALDQKDEFFAPVNKSV